MKPVAFEYLRPATVAEALALLTTQADAKIIAGGQTLGPLLNLRLARPRVVIDITRIADLTRVHHDQTAITLGATLTHAAIEDGRVPDPAGGLLRLVAAGIGHRAVRTRGTLGGSLAHADPAADWLSCLAALDAELLIEGPQGSRRARILEFVRGAMETALERDELIVAIRVPKLSQRARCGYHRICRKTGEFADAIAVVVCDPERRLERAVVNSPAGAPCVLGGGDLGSAASLAGELAAAGFPAGSYEHNVRVAALQLANKQVHAT
jgi:carbon-monoxide dehydrogenase medium subunit